MTAPPVRPPVALSSARGSKQRDRTILVVDDHVAFAEALASVVDDVPGLHAFAATTTEQAQRAIAEFDLTSAMIWSCLFRRVADLRVRSW